MLSNIAFVSIIHQHESAIGINMPPPSRTSLLLPTPTHPSRLSPNTRFTILNSSLNWPRPNSIYLFYYGVSIGQYCDEVKREWPI